MTGKRLKAITAVLVVVFYLAPIARADIQLDRPARERSALERLLGNHKVINLVDDFLVFWDQAKDKTPRVQRRIWMRTVESRHRDYFERAVYRGADRRQRRAMLDEFLLRVPERVEAIRELNRTITTSLIEAIINFRDYRFNEYQHQQDVYFGLSFFKFDGAVRPVHNDDGIPDTLCLGAELLAGYTSDEVRMAIIHEFFHLYHFGFLFKEEGISAAEFRTPHIPLLIEGMAVAGAEEAYPGQPRSLYLHFTEDELASQQRKLESNAGKFLDLIRSSAPPDQYERWFTKSYDEQVPPRAGYLLGHEVAKRMMAVYRLEEMVRMSPVELRAHAEDELAAMSGYRVLLMADAR